jgi:solute carrier family 8 (sodium/calcium exchanger)
VPLIDKGRNCVDNKFKVDIDTVTDISGKACMSEYTTAIVIIVHDNGTAGLMDKAMRAMNVDKRQLTDGSKNWVKQIKDTMIIGGGDDEDEPIDELEDEGITLLDAILWFIALPWMVLFAVFIPPVEYCGGGAAFVLSLSWIGIVTVFVGDLAYLFGCVLDLPLSFTAITFVALGTSLPDTFASRGAALHDSNADASIGNVTGSNSVNVFLGLGLPWLAGALYWDQKKADSTWYGKYGKEASDGTRTEGSDPDVPTIGYKYPDGALIYPSGSLVFSVMVFFCCALCCIAILALRRRLYGCELGGPRIPAIISACLFVLLWLGYITASGLEIWNVINPTF